MIKHYPISKTEQVVQHYSDKDGVPVKYVCTTEFLYPDQPADIFYRKTPHPKFGNKYFGIRFVGNDPYIFNADDIEKFTFGMVENDDGNLEYSQFRHECKTFKNGNMIDGGRSYIRSSGKFTVYNVRNGELVKNDSRIS